MTLLFFFLLSALEEARPTTKEEIIVIAKQDRDAPQAATAGVIHGEEIERRPIRRAGDVLESIPGVIVSQHSGEGKANQYYLRGFNLDHGTDIAITVAGVPVNMPTHAHGQGYADANFVIPELISDIEYKKGPYYADEGDFASAGAVHVNYRGLLDRPIALAQAGMYGYERGLVAMSPRVDDGILLFAVEGARNEGPWVRPDDFRRFNAFLRYSTGAPDRSASITAMAYDARWSSTDQIPARAVRDGSLSRFGNVDPTDGGTTSRYSLAADWQRASETRSTELSAYAMNYRLDLFSNFTYFLDDPVNGDQFEQFDDRMVFGLDAAQRWLTPTGENVAGLRVRRDDIDRVGLYHTASRTRLETVREDAITQTAVSAYVQNSKRWSSRVRTVAGVRVDRYAFDVEDQLAVGGWQLTEGPRSTANRQPPTVNRSIVSPKLSVVLGPIYLNAGGGFHSNDARSGSPLTRTKGAEIGVRTTRAKLSATAALWALDIDSELVFVGDAGTTEESGASRRRGVEIAATYQIRDGLALDAQYAYSRARFASGDQIPGAVEGVASMGISVADWNRFSGDLRYRYFGPRPLIEDDSVRSHASSLVNARAGYALTPRLRLDVDLFNLLDANVSDVDYFYTSRLRDETSAVDDIHFHPMEKRSLRIGIASRF